MVALRLCSCRNSDGDKPKPDAARCRRVLSYGYDTVYQCKLGLALEPSDKTLGGE